MLKPNDQLLEFELIRVFNAPRDLVWSNWIDPDAVAEWFAADTWQVTASRLDPRVGGHWRVDFVSEDRRSTYTEHGIYTELTRPTLLSFTMIQSFANDTSPEMLVRVALRDLGGQTELHFHQSGFSSAAHRDGMEGGWSECLDKFAARLARELAR